MVTSPDTSDAALAALAGDVARLCLREGRTVSTAESCTGGYIAKVLTDVAGSSRWFTAGFVSYSNEAKTLLLGVPADLIAEHGAVSAPVVQAMAEGALRRAVTQRAVAVSGIAGPGGGSAAKPVGTVWLACASTAADPRVMRFDFPGDRDQVRRATVRAALEALRVP